MRQVQNQAVTEAISGEVLDLDDPLLPTEELRTAMRWARAQAGKPYAGSTLPDKSPGQPNCPGPARSVKEIERVQP